MTQEQALNILKTGVNVFLTGEPGSGKTYTINTYVRWLRKHGIEPAITASTGIAATHIGGMTIHSFSGIGVAEFLSDWDVDRIATIERVARRVSATSILIIDEVSMLAANTLQMVDRVFKEVRRSKMPFGGVQVILVGDFFQLPPVVREGKTALYAFESEAWQFLNPAVCYLTDQYRQDDQAFLEALYAIRHNSVAQSHRESFLRRRIDFTQSPKDAPKLFAHNVDVDRINAQELAKLPGEPSVFTMNSKGRRALVEQLKRGCLSPENLELKKNAAVIFTKNSPQGRFVNGTLGVVADFDESSGLPIIKIKNGPKIEGAPMKWQIEEHGSVKASIEQIPLRLAWAITVHKSQGITLDEAVIDLSKAFEYGQGYVALSRVRSLSGLHLLGINDKALTVHPKILSKDEEFRTNSTVAEETLNSLLAELTKLHEQFIKACGGEVKETDIKKKSIKTGFDKIREKHPNAYRPWDEQHDTMLRELFGESKPIKELAQTFGRKYGAIRSRLLKLGLIKD